MLEDKFRKLLSGDFPSPEGPALIGQNETWSWPQLRAASAHLVDMLETVPGGLVLIHGHKEPAAVAAMIAATWTCRGYVFADRSNPQARIDQIAAVSGAAVVVETGQDTAGLPLPSYRCPASGELFAGRGNLADMKPFPGDRTLYVTFTSGSTGEPKGIAISRRNFDSFLDWFGAICDSSEGRAGGHVNHANFAFDMSASDIWPALLSGRPVFLLDQRNNINPRATLKQLAISGGPGTWASTPAFMGMMLSDPAFSSVRLGKLKTFFVGGEQVNKPMLRTLLRRFPGAEIFHGYGPSEATCITHCRLLDPRDLSSEGPLPLGATRGDNGMRLVDAEGNDVPAGHIGEIELLGPQVSCGYWPTHHPANSAFRHSGAMGASAYRTGDFGWIDGNGDLFVEGRQDGQVKWNGNRIEIGEIERTVLEIDAVQNAVVLVERTPSGEVKCLNLVVQSLDPTSAFRDSVARHIKARLPSAYAPRMIEVIGMLPMTPAGKVDRKRLALEFASS